MINMIKKHPVYPVILSKKNKLALMGEEEDSRQILEVSYIIGAGDGIRTRDFNLGKVALYP